MHDIASLEEAGVPGVVVCTTPFERPVHLQWRALGHAGDAPVVVVGHPLGSMPQERVLGEAEAAVQRIVAVLVRRDD